MCFDAKLSLSHSQFTGERITDLKSQQAVLIRIPQSDSALVRRWLDVYRRRLVGSRVQVCLNVVPHRMC